MQSKSSFAALILSLALIAFNRSAAKSNLFFQDREEWFQQMALRTDFGMDPSANAIILYEKCTSDLWEGMDNTVRHQIRRIIKISSKAGVEQGDINILVPKSKGAHVDIRNVKGVTYKIRDGKLIHQDLQSDGIAKSRADFMLQVKFSMPAVEEGAVLDISYSIQAPKSLQFASWEFQHDIPTCYSELEVYVPAYLGYSKMRQGNATYFLPFNDKKKSLSLEEIPEAYTSLETVGDIHHERWVRRNVPAVIEEPFAPPIINFRDRLVLRVNTLTVGPYTSGILDTWDKLNESLYESFGYYQALVHKQASVMQQSAELTGGISGVTEKAKVIYRFVRDGMNSEGYTSIWLGEDLEKVLTNRNGSPSEINFLLIAMLRFAGIPAEPVAISTTDHRAAVADFPEMFQFNRTICQTTIEGKNVYLDASGKNTPFGQLPQCDYNGYARVVAKKGINIYLDPESLNERSLVSVTTEKDDATDYRLRVAYTFGSIAAQSYRMQWRKDSSSISGMVMNNLNKLGTEASLLEYRLSGLHNPDTSLVLSFSIRINWPKEGKLYLNPHLISTLSRNPFSAATRTLPVQLTSAQDAYMNAQIKLPEGYKLEEAPKPSLVNVNKNDYHKYLVSYDESSRLLQINARVHAERTWYSAEDYPLIKQFYDKIIAQEASTYVFTRL